MRCTSRVGVLFTLLPLFWATAMCAAATADAPSTSKAKPPGDEMIVRGDAIVQFRLRIRFAEDAVFARFNEINSDDRFDIHCYEQTRLGSHIEQRVCASNSWREEEANFAQASLVQFQGAYSGNPQQYIAAQQLWQQRLTDEMRRLTLKDPELHANMVRLGQTYAALEAVTGQRAVHTLYRDVPPGENGLPYDAHRLVQVRVGIYPWIQQLTARTFAFGPVSGHIRNMRVECENGEHRLELQDDVEWTIPEAWGACTLTVAAKRETTFSFVEF